MGAGDGHDVCNIRSDMSDNSEDDDSQEDDNAVSKHGKLTLFHD